MVFLCREVVSNGSMSMYRTGFQFTLTNDLHSVTTVAPCCMALFVRVSSVKVSQSSFSLWCFNSLLALLSNHLSSYMLSEKFWNTIVTNDCTLYEGG